jgi:hypothetical protein
MTTGVAIHLGLDGNGDTSYMLDMTPNSRANDRLDPALVEGKTFQDPDTGITITTDSVTAGGAVVTVRLPSATTVPSSTSTTASAVTVVTDQPSYSRNQQVSISTIVKSGTAPVAGASVTITITDAAGSVTTANATTGSDGTALYKLRLKRQSPPGTYAVGAVARKDALSGTATTSFTVR